MIEAMIGIGIASALAMMVMVKDGRPEVLLGVAVFIIIVIYSIR